jgi:hypothetical protein
MGMSGISKSQVSRLCAEIDERVSSVNYFFRVGRSFLSGLRAHWRSTFVETCLI